MLSFSSHLSNIFFFFLKKKNLDPDNISHPKPIYFRLRFVDVLLICRGIGSYIHYYFKLRFKIKSNKNNYIWYEFHWHTVNSSFLNIYWHWCKFTIFIFFLPYKIIYNSADSKMYSRGPPQTAFPKKTKLLLKRKKEFKH